MASALPLKRQSCFVGVIAVKLILAIIKAVQWVDVLTACQET